LVSTIDFSGRKESAMRRFGYVLIAAVCIILFWAPMVSAQEVSPADLETYFSKMIDNKIACCQKTASFRHSRHQNIRQDADCAWLKQAYYREYKKELVKEMISKHVGTKPHQIDYFLIKSFYNTVRE
jgi:hypothetical protein